MKKLTLSILGVGISWAAWAQETAETAQAASATDPYLFQKIMTTTIFVMAAAVLVAAVLTLLRLSEALSKNIVGQYLGEQGRTLESAAQPAVAAPKKPSLWQRLTDAVPVERQHEIAFDHAFDGIQELDNKLPPWWVGMFYVTIAFAVIYFTYHEVLGWGDSSAVQYEKEMAAAEEMKLARLAALGAQVDENTATLVTDEAALAEAKGIFAEKCVACHGAEGQGGVGPNFTDEYWLHGGSVKDLFKVVKYGVPAKGMIAWESQLTPPQIQNIASYILSLKGTNPPNPKAPQGELYVAENAAAAPSDSTATETPADM
jgi:cytochrome c oxidase cbb3-type subunit III